MNDKDEKKKVPPGQRVVSKKRFPILHYDDVPEINPENFKLKIFGAVEKKITLTWEELMKLPKVKIKDDFHCVTGWSVLDVEWEGIPYKEIHKLARPKTDAKFVMFGSYDGYTTNVPLEYLLDDNVILAYKLEGELLHPYHGGPLRLVLPKLYGWKSAKWVASIEYMTKNRLGYWELRVYHLRGDPWKEERYG
ncbi:MAG: sulfite oxidase-like oxidoreductase [Candidatus Odinarchaeota archaeon]|nr:sulfite oxidase-like oxidoreductase [Candidatus Odinarchaeota archaeon]